MSDASLSNVNAVNATESVPTLLFVDDEPAILSSLRSSFRPPNYRVFMAASGAEGLTILAREKVDMVISDARMPEMDGATFLKKVYEQWPDVMRVMLTGYADISTTIAAINEGKIYRYLNKPWDEHVLRETVDSGLRQRFLEYERERLEKLTQQQKAELAKLNNSLERQVKARTAELQQTADMLDASYAELKATYETTVRVFSSLIHMRKGLSSKSAQRVLQAVRKLSPLCGIVGESELRDTIMAASLYNVGKLAWTDALLSKSFDQLSNDEWDEVKRYPAQAETILMALDPLKDAVKIIRHHQEQYDGRGYPNGVAGEAIPAGARVLKLIIDFEALVTGQYQGKPLPVPKAIEFLKAQAGKIYDPQMVSRFVELLEKTGVQDSAAAQEFERLVQSGQLAPNMELARDLYSSDGILLLNKGKLLTDIYIARILAFERAENARFAIYVRPPEPVAQGAEA